MTEPSAKYDPLTRQIFWRGTNAAWIYKDHDSAVRLRDLFVNQVAHASYAKLLAHDLTTAIEAYEAHHVL